MPHLARERVRRRALGLEGNLGEGRKCLLGFAVVDRVLRGRIRPFLGIALEARGGGIVHKVTIGQPRETL